MPTAVAQSPHSHPMQFAEIDVSAIHESKHNPRRHFDEAALKELAENIAQVGILSPLLVRPDPQGTVKAPRYEIAAGHRRYRAAKLAKLTLLPCLVRPMTDQEFVELLNIENLQREGLHPLDEAKGYEALMAAPYTMDVQTIAQKVGRSVKYVYDRVKLLALSKPAQELFWDGRIEAGHAILLARLTPSEQAKVIGSEDTEYADGGLFQAEHRLFDTEDEAEEDGPMVKARSVRELEAWIKEHIRFNVQQADAFLFPETVAQVQAATEEQRKIIEITHEYLAADDVRQAGAARIYGERAWQRADGHEGSKVCDRSVLGVIASGPGQGQAFPVCVNKDRCRVHWGAAIKAREKRAKQREQGGAARKPDRYAQDEARRKADEAREQAARDRWKAATPAILTAVAERVTTLPANANGLLAQIILSHLKDYQGTLKRAGTYLSAGTTAEELLRFAAFVVLFKEVSHSWWAPREFPKRAKVLGLDLATLLPAEAPEVQTSAVKGKKKGKAS